MSSVVTVTMLISLSEVDTPAHPSAPSSALPPATTSRCMPALPWWTVLTWDRRLSTRLNPRPHLSHKKGFSPERAGREECKRWTNKTSFPPLLIKYWALILLPVWMMMCFERSPTLTKALLHIWHLWGRTLSWCRMWLASWLDCTNLSRQKHETQTIHHKVPYTSPVFLKSRLRKTSLKRNTDRSIIHKLVPTQGQLWINGVLFYLVTYLQTSKHHFRSYSLWKN